MTVRELIEMLLKCGLDMEVVVDKNGYAMEIEKLDVYEFKNTFIPHPDPSPCIGIKISNLLGTVENYIN